METKDFVLFDANDHVVEPEKIKELKRQPTPLPGAQSPTSGDRFAGDSPLEGARFEPSVRSKGTASPEFSRPAAPRCQRQQGPENVMHASHQGIGRARCGVFYVKMVRRLMTPAGINVGDEAVRNGVA